MGREKIKLTVERAGTGIRYRRSVNGKVWTSKVYERETRQSKREAWESFTEWRSRMPPTELTSKGNLLHAALGERAQVLLDHAIFTEDRDSVRVWKGIIHELPSMDEQQLYALTATLFGEVNGVSHEAVIKDRQATIKRLQKGTATEFSARELADEFCREFNRKAETNRGSWGRYGQVKAGLDLFVEWYGPSRSLTHLSEKTVKDYVAHLEESISSGSRARTTAHDYQKAFQTFITSIAEDYPDDVPVPSNLRSKRL